MKKTLEEINEEGTKFVGELLDGEKKGIAPTLDDLRKLTALVDEGAKIAV